MTTTCNDEANNNREKDFCSLVICDKLRNIILD